MSEHRFPWKWYLADLKNVPQNGCKVFSCFSCGGGSSMGYKLAGYQVIGNCEIDPQMNEIYKYNHHPRYSYLMDIRDFCVKDNSELPPELFDLDVLDGSPPCSVFSVAGQREKGWNKDKKFREGQKLQRLDDLFFAFVDVAEKLKPKVIIAENVKGLVTGQAKGYVADIIKAFGDASYTVQLFLLNGAQMGVPQKRERVFFVAHRKDLALPKLSLDFHEKPITFGEVRSKEGVPNADSSLAAKLLAHRRKVDKTIGDIHKRLGEKESGFTQCIFNDKEVCGTVVSGGNYYRFYDGMKLSEQDFVAVQTFPQDYDFRSASPQYVCGMSVPPVMMANIASEVYKQWLSRVGSEVNGQTCAG